MRLNSLTISQARVKKTRIQRPWHCREHILASIDFEMTIETHINRSKMARSYCHSLGWALRHSVTSSSTRLILDAPLSEPEAIEPLSIPLDDNPKLLRLSIRRLHKMHRADRRLVRSRIAERLHNGNEQNVDRRGPPGRNSGRYGSRKPS